MKETRVHMHVCAHTHMQTEYVSVYTHSYLYQIETVAWRTDDRKTLEGYFLIFWCFLT